MSFAPEDQLLVQCSRVKMGDEAIAMASDLLRRDLDWDYVVEASIRHGVSPLFYYGLKQVSQVVDLDTLVPVCTMEELEKLYRGNQSRNRRLYSVIGDIFKAFGQAGIQALGLKDVQLAMEVYPDVGLRPMGDIDVLIHREDYEKVAACMADLGFVPLPSPNIPFTLKYAWAHHFRRPDDNVWVDVQWNVLQIEWDVYREGNFDFEIDRMWRGANLMTIDDCQIRVPKPEDMLFHLCLHLEGHAYSELILFCDIAELLRHCGHRLDWQYLVDITKKYKVESSVYYVLFQVQRLFKAPLPPFLLRKLEPAYFKASMYGPIFGNLTPLHLALDEIRQAAFPPDEVMGEFEAAVRQQAVSAMQLYKEVDDIACAFTGSGGSVMILDGTPSEKVFPDPFLRSFEEIRFLVLDRDLPRMRQTLSNCGFKPGDAHGSGTYKKEWEMISVDPVLADRPTRITLQGDIERNLDYLFRPEENNHASKKDMALRLIKAKLAGHKNDPTDVPVQIKIMALSPEDMLLYLGARLGEQEQNRLFGLNSLLEFFRGYSDPLDWQQIAHKAQLYGVSESVGEGLLMASELLDNDQVPPVALTLLTGSASPPRVLEWARYGPAEFYTDFKGAFFYLLCFVSVNGLKAKSRYLLRSLFGEHENKPALPGLMLKIMTGTVSLLQGKQHKATDFAYWVEPEPALETEPGNN